MASYRLAVRHDTAANWTSADPILASGEFGYESDTGELKIGDGTSLWSALDYLIQAAPTSIDDLLDVDTTTVAPVGGDVLKWTGTVWAPTTDDDTEYTDADVDAHLNISAAATGEILSWDGSDYDWISAPTGGASLWTDNTTYYTSPEEIVVGSSTLSPVNLNANYTGITVAGGSGGAINFASTSGTLHGRIFGQSGKLNIRPPASGKTVLGDDNGLEVLTIDSPTRTVTFGWTSDSPYTFPMKDGDADQVLVTDGSGTLTWEDPASGGGSGLWQDDTTYASYGNPIVVGSTTLGPTSFGPDWEGVTMYGGSSGAALSMHDSSGNLQGRISSHSSGLLIRPGTSSQSVHIEDHNGTDIIKCDASNQVITFNNDYSFPTSDGTANQVLTTNGSGTVTWEDGGSGGGSLWVDNTSHYTSLNQIVVGSPTVQPNNINGNYSGITVSGPSGGAVNFVDGTGNLLGRVFGSPSQLSLRPKTGGTVSIDNSLGIGVMEVGDTTVTFGSESANPYTFPAQDGAVDQVLVTDGSGTLTWEDPATGGGGSLGIDDNATTTQLTIEDTGSTFNSDVAITRSHRYGTAFELENTSTGGKAWELRSTGVDNLLGTGDLQFNVDSNSSLTLKADGSAEFSGDLTASGNVGVGTNAPNSMGWGTALTVNSSTQPAVELAKDGTATGYFASQSDGRLRLGNQVSGQPIQFLTADAGVAAVIDGAGNVGIGTVNTGNAALSVSNPNTSGNVYSRINSSTADREAGLQFADQDALKWTLFKPASSGSLGFFNHTSGSTAMTLDASGNVGIGSSDTHNRKLSVAGTGDLVELRSTNSGAGGAQLDLIHDSINPADGDFVGNINFSTATATMSSIRARAASVGSNLGELHFGTRNSGTYNASAMVLDATGNLLVGTTDTSLIANQDAGVYLHADGTIDNYSGAATSLNLGRANNGVMMQFWINGGNTSGGISTVQGGTPTFYASSDGTLKNNIVDHESELANVMSLRPTRWDWNKTEQGSGEGFIAQELELTAWSDLVAEGSDGYKTVAGLGTVETRLIKAMQEQQVLIVGQQALITALTTRVEALENV
jgi:hypothetical protein